MLSGLQLASSCTVFVVGKKATVDGSVLVSHSNDGEFDTVSRNIFCMYCGIAFAFDRLVSHTSTSSIKDPRLVKVPAADHEAGSIRNVYFSPESYPRYVGKDRNVKEYYPKSNEQEFKPIGSIPQVEHTFAYLEDTYGAVNEHQVGIGESTCSGVFGAIPLGAPNGTALFSVDQLTQIAMERSKTAREAVELMGDLAEKHGFYGAGEFEGTAESLAVSDSQEAYIFHILPDPTGYSAIWAAQRVPDDSMAILANMFIIRQVDPNDPENFVMSDSVHTVAKEYGWWKEDDGLLDFTKVYSDGEYAHKYYSGRRMWGGFHLAAPSKNFPADYTDLQSDPVYPVYTKPDFLLSAKDLFQFHRYYYQGTKYDLGGETLAGGPFGSPDRWKEGPAEAAVKGNWERSIGLYRTSDTYVVQSRSSEAMEKGGLGAIMWYAPASPNGSIFTPFIVNLSDIPISFRSGHQQKFDRTSMFWAACFAHNVAQLKWSYAVKDIERRQNHLEDASVALVQGLDIAYKYSKDIDYVEDAYLKNVEKIVSSLWSLSDELMFKYASGFVNESDNMSQMVGYPEWWLKAVKYEDGPPPPPTTPKCCNPEKGGPSANKHSFLRVETIADAQNGLSMLTGKAAMRHFLKQN